MKYINFATAVMMAAIIAVSCSQDDESVSIKQTNKQDHLSDASHSARYNFPWEYVMDARYSRGTCSTGPGVCFKNGYGDIFSPSFVDNTPDDGDTGPIGMHLEGDKMHFTFFRSLEEDVFIIREDVQLNEKLATALGQPVIILKAGQYNVRFDAYKHGEAFVTLLRGN